LGPRRHGRCDTPNGNHSLGENRPMTVPMERVENRIPTIRTAGKACLMVTYRLPFNL
jgi:hypothetical protein